VLVMKNLKKPTIIVTKDHPIDAKWVKPSSRLYLAIVTRSELRLWDPSKAKIIWSVTCKELLSKGSKMKDTIFFRCVTCTHDAVCLGTSDGQVLILREPKKSRGTLSCDLILGTVKSGLCPITCICADPDSKTLAAGNGMGMIFVWACIDKSSTYEDTMKFLMNKKQDSPCMTIAIRESYVVAGFDSGHIRIFSMKRKGSMIPAVEVAAHARCITALAFHPKKNIFATVGEDTSFNVWKMPDRLGKLKNDSVHIELIHSAIHKDVLFTGIVMTKNSVICSAYDQMVLFEFRRGSK
jgi:WD40 repeat protein